MGASHPKKNQPANPNNKKQHVSFLQSDTQQWGGAGDEEVPGGQGGGKQLGQLGGLISTFLGPAAVEAAFPLLEALTKAGQEHLAKSDQDGQEQPRKGENQETEEQV